MAKPADPYKTEEIMYHYKRVGMSTRVTGEFFEHSEAPELVAREFINNHINFFMAWETAERKLISRRWTLNWQEALKERFAPEWFKQRWPVRYGEFTLREVLAVKRNESVELRDRLRYTVGK